MVNFAKFNDPEYKAEMARKREERDRKHQLINEWRQITAGATGHRPEKMGGYYNALGGYNRNHPIAVELREQTLKSLEELIVNHGITRFISGGALGFDTMFFWCVHHLKKKYPHIQNVVAIPFQNQWIKWKETLPEAVKWYFEMLKLADMVIDVAREEEYRTNEDRGSNPLPLDDFSKKKMNKRNEYMADQIRYLVAFYDGSKSGTGHCVNYAMRNTFNRPVILRMDPRYHCNPEFY